MPLPFEKFYPKDWEGDAQLMSCSLATRALWRHMLNTMREADPFGFFVGRNGEPIDLIAYAKRINARPAEVRRCYEELVSKGVASVDRSGRLFSRRYLREFAASQAASEFGKQGGNPALKPTGGITEGDKALSCAGDTRVQIPDNSESLRSSAVTSGKWPTTIEGLRQLALVFVAEFANCRDPIKAEKHVGAYTGVLAAIRGRGLAIMDAWQACEDAREACGGRPLWGAGVKTAMNFLAARPASQPTRPRLANDRGTALHEALEAKERRDMAS